LPSYKDKEHYSITLEGSLFIRNSMDYFRNFKDWEYTERSCRVFKLCKVWSL